MNYLIIESLLKVDRFFGEESRVEWPVGSGRKLSLKEIAKELQSRLMNIFRRDGKSRRAVFGRYEKMQVDPHFRDYVLFHEYFDGDDGHGLGASHETGWSGLVANMIAECDDQI